jgi:hypothetical protein
MQFSRSAVPSDDYGLHSGALAKAGESQRRVRWRERDRCAQRIGWGGSHGHAHRLRSEANESRHRYRKKKPDGCERKDPHMSQLSPSFEAQQATIERQVSGNRKSVPNVWVCKR